MSPGILIFITDGKGRGRLEIDGRLDLFGQFLAAIYGNEGKRPDLFTQSDPARVTAPAILSPGKTDEVPAVERGD
jgi:hypothetical protein